MKKHPILRTILTILATLILTPTIIGLTLKMYFDFQIGRQTSSIDRGRPENAECAPAPSDDITDIRMTVVPRDVRTMDMLGISELYENLTVLQIWYGYQSDGQWYDYPSENYELVGLWDDGDNTGWRAAFGSHIGKIGPYLLICVSPPVSDKLVCEVTDSLNSPVQEPFADYFTCYVRTAEDGTEVHFMDKDKQGYGYIAEDIFLTEDTETPTARLKNTFSKRYYVVLEYDAIPDDYLLDVTYSDGAERIEYSLSKDEIDKLLGQ